MGDRKVTSWNGKLVRVPIAQRRGSRGQFSRSRAFPLEPFRATARRSGRGSLRRPSIGLRAVTPIPLVRDLFSVFHPSSSFQVEVIVGIPGRARRSSRRGRGCRRCHRSCRPNRLIRSPAWSSLSLWQGRGGHDWRLGGRLDDGRSGPT